MKIAKRIGISILALLVLLLAVSFFLPSKIRVERSLVMKAPVEKPFEQVNTLKNWENWSPWHQMDPNIKLTYDGPQSGEGAIYSWTSEEVGNGRLTILTSEPNRTIVTAMDFMENGTATGTYTFEETPEGTKVTWAMDSDMGSNPVSKLFGLLMESFVGKDFENGLQNLKTLVEQEKATS